MKDQLEAFRWVKQNIIAFGGDPSKITIFGESAGGMSISLHTISPQGEGLYRSAIAQSGTALTFTELYRNGKIIADHQKFAQEANCTKTQVDVVECLQKLDPITFVLGGLSPAQIYLKRPKKT